MWARYIANAIQAENGEEAKEKVSADFDVASLLKSEEGKMIIENEIIYLDAIFKSDAKNYHAWSHKIWLIERYELWRDPSHIVFIEDLLD